MRPSGSPFFRNLASEQGVSSPYDAGRPSFTITPDEVAHPLGVLERATRREWVASNAGLAGHFTPTEARGLRHQ